jgi:hypothetical protein
MPVKDPWKRPKTDTWLKEGARIVHNRGDHPRQSPVWVVTRIETTGNGTQMIHLASEEDPKVVAAKWACDILGKNWLSRVEWMPVPKPPRAPRPKREPKSRFEREEPI